jgi:hypothetical protein
MKQILVRSRVSTFVCTAIDLLGTCLTSILTGECDMRYVPTSKTPYACYSWLGDPDIIVTRVPSVALAIGIALL